MEEIQTTAKRAKLSLDLITEILPRLSFKSVVRFRCVSKEWYALINSCFFKNLQKKHRKTCSYFVLFWDRILENETKMQSIRLQVIDLESITVKKPTKFYSDFRFGTTVATKTGFGCDLVRWNRYYATSCNGLVCIANEYSREQVYVINPITNHVLRLPPPYQPYVDEYYGSRICIGFLPSTNQYKIVNWHHLSETIRGHHYYKYMGCEILALTDAREDPQLGSSSSSSSPLTWRKSSKYLSWDDANFHGCPFRMYNISICVNGVMYWLISNYFHIIALAAFDLETEESMIIPAPDDDLTTDDPYLEDMNHISFTELGGSLCLVQSYGGYVRMLVKEESQSGLRYHWSPKVHISYNEAHGPPFRLRKDFNESFNLWNAESGKVKRIFVHNEKKKAIHKYGDDDNTWEGKGSNLAIIRRHRFDNKLNKWILFQENSLFLLE